MSHRSFVKLLVISLIALAACVGCPDSNLKAMSFGAYVQEGNKVGFESRVEFEALDAFDRELAKLYNDAGKRFQEISHQCEKESTPAGLESCVKHARDD